MRRAKVKNANFTRAAKLPFDLPLRRLFRPRLLPLSPLVPLIEYLQVAFLHASPVPFFRLVTPNRIQKNTCFAVCKTSWQTKWQRQPRAAENEIHQKRGNLGDSFGDKAVAAAKSGFKAKFHKGNRQ